MAQPRDVGPRKRPARLQRAVVTLYKHIFIAPSSHDATLDSHHSLTGPALVLLDGRAIL